MRVTPRRALLETDDERPGLRLRFVEVPPLTESPAMRRRFEALMKGCKFNLNGDKKRLRVGGGVRWEVLNVGNKFYPPSSTRAMTLCILCVLCARVARAHAT